VTSDWELIVRHGAWQGRVRRHDVRAFNRTLWGWEFTHDAIGDIASGISRTRALALDCIEAELSKWPGRAKQAGHGDLDLIRRDLDRVTRALREVLNGVRGVAAAHDAECWAEIANPNAAEEAELLSHTVGQVRAALDLFEIELRATPE
jgi:hypothetical protein